MILKMVGIVAKARSIQVRLLTTFIRRNGFRLFTFILCIFAGCEIPQFPYYISAEEELLVIDFLVVRYSWVESDGLDLDTRTAITRPDGIAGEVGWNRDEQVGPSSTPYLQWASDNTDTGFEAVLINLVTLRNNFPEETKFQFRLRAFWYEAKRDGNFTLEFIGYRGGAMVQEAYNWVNQGGQEERRITVTRNVTTQRELGTDGNLDGEEVGIAGYEVVTKVLEITNP